MEIACFRRFCNEKARAGQYSCDKGTGKSASRREEGGGRGIELNAL
jgi:hypothetical protein